MYSLDNIAAASVKMQAKQGPTCPVQNRTTELCRFIHIVISLEVAQRRKKLAKEEGLIHGLYGSLSTSFEVPSTPTSRHKLVMQERNDGAHPPATCMPSGPDPSDRHPRFQTLVQQENETGRPRILIPECVYRKRCSHPDVRRAAEKKWSERNAGERLSRTSSSRMQPCLTTPRSYGCTGRGADESLLSPLGGSQILRLS